MKVQHDTSWNSTIDDTVIEKPVDKLEETNQESTQYSSTLTDIRTWKDSRQKTNPQKPKKRHRFPPSLLSSRAVDFWNALMPLRADCSCSSVSLGNKYSRLSISVSNSDATFGSNLESSVPSAEGTAVRETLGDTLEQSQLFFRLIISRMVRLFNVLDKKSDSSLSRVRSEPNLKILSLSEPKLKESTETIGRDSRCKFSSITSVSNKSSDIWSTVRTGMKSESSTTFEIAERKRRGRGLYSQKSILPNSLKITNSVLTLTNEELVYLLQYKKTLLSEYFRRNDVDSTDLDEKLEFSEKNSVVYGSQSDSGLQVNDLLQFVQFIRERKEKDDEDLTKLKVPSLATQKPETRITPVYNEDSRQLSPPKRRVTFSDPITDESMTVLDCDSTENEDSILSAQNSATVITNDLDGESDQLVQSDSLDDSKSLKTCFTNLSLDSLSTKYHDTDKYDLGICEPVIEREQENGQNPNVTDEDFEEVVAVMETETPQETKSWSTGRPSLLQKGWRGGYGTGAGKIEEEMLVGLKFLVKETVDWGTTHVPMSIEVFEECSGRQISDKSMNRKIQSMEDSDLIDYERNTSASKLQNKSITGCSNTKQSKIPVKCNKKRITWNLPVDHHPSDTAVAEERSSSHLGKSVTFQDCCETVSDQSVIVDQNELESSDDKLDSLSESNGRFELSWKGCWDQQSTSEVFQNGEKSEDNEGQFLESNPVVLNESSELTSIETYRDEPNLDSGLENDVQSADDHRSKQRIRNLRASSPSTFPYSSDDDSSKSCKLVSEFNELQDRTELRQGLKNLYEGIRNPEIWRAEVRPAMAEAFSKSDWYARPDSDRYPWKIPRVGSDWLIRKLEELQSSPETYYESDYYAESETSDHECGRDLSPFSNLNAQLKNCRRFKAKRSRFDPNLFLREIWSRERIIFNECRCRKNRPGEHDARHTSFQGFDRRSKHNIFSHLRARLILDSETDDSDFAPSIQSDFYYNSNRREEHVNKIKCRRYVRPLKNIESEENRRFLSSGLSHGTLEKSFTPASVQCAFTTRTLGTNVSTNTMTDVSIDTNDLCPHKPIETINQAPELTISNDNIGCQTVKNELHNTQVSLGSNSQVPKTREQRLSSVVPSASTQINDASDNLAKLRLSEIRALADLDVSPSVSKPTNVRTSSGFCAVNQSSCPICNADQKPTPRYVLPACVVKGADPGSKANEKDPWNRVMERAKVQHRYEGRNKSTSSDIKPSRALSSSSTPLNDVKCFERKDKEIRKEGVRIELVQVEVDSPQYKISGTENFTPVEKIDFTPTRKLQPLDASSPTSSNANFPMLSLPRARSPRRSEKPQAIANAKRLLYIITEKTEPTHLRMTIKSPAENFLDLKIRK